MCQKHNFPLQTTTKGSDTTSEDKVVVLEFLLKAEKRNSAADLTEGV